MTHRQKQKHQTIPYKYGSWNVQKHRADKTTTLINLWRKFECTTLLCLSIFFHVQRNQWQQSVNCMEWSVKWFISPKYFLRIIIMRVRKKFKSEIGEEQDRFVALKSTTNAIYTLRIIIERALEVQIDVYLCFIDYTKAFWQSTTWWDIHTINTF